MSVRPVDYGDCREGNIQDAPAVLTQANCVTGTDDFHDFFITVRSHAFYAAGFAAYIALSRQQTVVPLGARREYVRSKKNA
jgi:hypothetical protein